MSGPVRILTLPFALIGRAGLSLIEPAKEMILDVLSQIGGVGNLTVQYLYWLLIAPFRGKGWDLRETFYQMVRVGVNSIPIVAILTFFVGLILAMQSAYILVKLGAQLYVPGLVGVSLFRELGPLLAAVILSGRVGASVAAEIGTMVVAEEIDALRCMALNPVRQLVIPRVTAILIMGPCLTILAMFMGVFGGYVFGVSELGIPGAQYVQETFNKSIPKDIITGMIKSGVFAGVIAFLSCYMGLIVKGGAEGVGKSTTTAVVNSIFTIIFVDAIFTAIFYFVFP